MSQYLLQYLSSVSSQYEEPRTLSWTRDQGSVDKKQGNMWYRTTESQDPQMAEGPLKIP